MQKNTAAETADTGNVPRASKREQLTPAEQLERDAFEVVSRKSRRAVADTVEQLVRPA